MSDHATQKSISQWANETFGRPVSNWTIARRALQEANELEYKLCENDVSPSAVEEAADVIIVLMRLFERFGADWQVEVDKKMAINRGRQWVLDGRGHGQHIKESK